MADEMDFVEVDDDEEARVFGELQELIPETYEITRLLLEAIRTATPVTTEVAVGSVVTAVYQLEERIRDIEEKLGT